MDTTSNTARLAETPLPELVAELGQLTASVNSIKARQVELVAAITHTHTIEAEDGTLLHLPMSDTYARLDAAALVAGSLGVSQQAAQHWVDRADKLTGPLTAVHAAMSDGVLDEARAKIICDELDEASDEVAAVVADHLMPAVRDGLSEDPSGESGVRLKRRVHAALAAVDPDAVKERAEKNRTDRCLRRWTSKAGVEEWLATLPATQSIRAWAAIDALAREFIKDGRSETLDQARADAMIALIEGQSTISYVVTLGIPIPDHLTDPAPAADPSDQPDTDDPDPSDHEPVADPSEPGPADPSEPDPAHLEPADPSNPGLADTDPRPEDDAVAQAAAPPVPENEGTGLEDDTEHTEPEPPEPAARGKDEAADGHPSQDTGANEPDAPEPDDTAGDADRGSPHASDIPAADSHTCERAEAPEEDSAAERTAERVVSARRERSVAEVVAAALAALARHGNSDIEITGAGNPQPTDVNAAWVADALAKAARDGKVRLAAVHPSTGALIDPHNAHTTTSYVPGKALAGLVKARDGRCRFPGCTLNVRFTDLDHVRPWPAGATSADNLHALCRRHHRIKQMVGWQVSLRPDGTTLWVDPIGRRYLTRALDHRGRPQSPPTPAPCAAEPSRHTSPQEQAAEQEARQRRIEAALRRETPVSILEEHLGHDLFDLDQEANRRAVRTGTPRPWREQVPFDIRYHAPSGQARLGQARLGKVQLGHDGTGHNRAGLPVHGQTRHIVLDLPERELVRRPRRPQYDEPPF